MEVVTRVVREKGHGKEPRKIHLDVDIETSLVSDMNSLIIIQAASHENWLLVGVKIDKSFIFSRWQSALD